MEKLELVVLNENNKPVLASTVNELLEVCEEECQKANQQYDLVKDMMLNAMLDNNLKKAETENFKVSVRENQSKWIFDEERFKKEAGKEIVEAFTKTEKTRTITLNVDKLKEKYPEVYEDCLDIKDEEVTSIDEHKLWENLRAVWSKFATEVKPDKVGTISIKRK